MFNKIVAKPFFLPVVILAILTGVVVSLKLGLKRNLITELSNSGYHIEKRDVTFRGYSSQNISANKGNEWVLLQIVRGVEKKDSDSVLKELLNPVDTINQKVVITDPYSGRMKELSIPDPLKPVAESLTVNGRPIPFYIVYANSIFSLKIFSEAEAKYKGIFSVFYCSDEKTAYNIEVFDINEHFNIDNAKLVLSSLICK